MENALKTIQKLLDDAIVIKLIEVTSGIIIVGIIFRILSQVLPRQVQEIYAIVSAKPLPLLVMQLWLY